MPYQASLEHMLCFTYPTDIFSLHANIEGWLSPLSQYQESLVFEEWNQAVWCHVYDMLFILPNMNHQCSDDHSELMSFQKNYRNFLITYFSEA